MINPDELKRQTREDAALSTKTAFAAFAEAMEPVTGRPMCLLWINGENDLQVSTIKVDVDFDLKAFYVKKLRQAADLLEKTP